MTEPTVNSAPTPRLKENAMKIRTNMKAGVVALHREELVAIRVNEANDIPIRGLPRSAPGR